MGFEAWLRIAQNGSELGKEVTWQTSPLASTAQVKRQLRHCTHTSRVWPEGLDYEDAEDAEEVPSGMEVGALVWEVVDLS